MDGSIEEASINFNQSNLPNDKLRQMPDLPSKEKNTDDDITPKWIPIINTIQFFFHYFDIVLDIILIFLYENHHLSLYSLITSLLLWLPNVLIILFFTINVFINGVLYRETNWDKLIKIVKIYFIFITHSQLFISTFIWLNNYLMLKKLSKLKNCNHDISNKHKHDMDFHDYFILISNMFHILFNSGPHTIIQLYNLNDLLFKEKNLLIIFIFIKFVISILRISFTTSYFISFFMYKEFFFKLKTEKLFLFRSFSNLIILIVRVLPYVLVLKAYFKIGVVVIILKFLLNFVYAYNFISNICLLDIEIEKNNSIKYVKYNNLRLFWTLFISFIKLLSNFEDFENSTLYILFCVVLGFLENAFLSIFIYLNYKDKYIYYVFIILLCFWLSIFIEFYFWKVHLKLKHKSIINRFFRKWISVQVKTQYRNLSDDIKEKEELV